MEELNYKGYLIRISPDPEPQDPRRWDNLGTMVCGHRRYNLGDIQVGSDQFPTVESTHQLVRRPDVISLPLYLYDHSILSISTRSWHGRAQHAEWDSGMVGYIFVTHEQLRKSQGWRRITQSRRQWALTFLCGEVSLYNSYLIGAVAGYEILQDEEVVDAVWGYYDYDDSDGLLRTRFTSGAEQAIEAAKQHIDWLIEAELKQGIQLYLPEMESHFPDEVATLTEKLS